MPLSLRARRLAVYDYSDTGTDGRRAQTFAKNASGDADGNWWGSIVVPSGREVEVAANKGYQVDAVIGLSAEVTVDPQGVIKDPASGATYKITAVLPRDAGRAEQQIMAQRVDDAQYTFDEFVATWRTHPRIVLLSEAEGQDTTQQIVRSTVGPDGWLGDSPANTTNDPTYASDPARWVFDEDADKQVMFGDVLNSALNSPIGFTVVVPIEVLTVVSGQRVVWHKHPFNLSGPLQGVRLLLQHSATGYYLFAHVNYTPTNDGDFVSASADAARMNAGRYVVGMHIDRSMPRASGRYTMWLNGEPLTTNRTFVSGADNNASDLNISGYDMALGSPISTLEAPVSMSGVTIARGVMPASWHANLYQDAVNRGWV